MTAAGVEGRPWQSGDGPDLDALDALTAAVDAIPSSRSREVMIRHFGLQGLEPQTLAAVGRAEALTRERIRQIVNRALAGISARSRRQEREEPGPDLLVALRLRAAMGQLDAESGPARLRAYVEERLGPIATRKPFAFSAP